MIFKLVQFQGFWVVENNNKMKIYTYFIDKAMLLHLSLSSEVFRFNKYFIHGTTPSCMQV